MSTGTPSDQALFCAANATVIGDVTIGDGVSIWFGAVVRADKDTISVGNETNIQDNAVVHTSAGHPVRLGTQVSVGHGAILHGCTIADRVLVGMGSIVMNGADIGTESIVGAGAVVTEGSQVPPRSLVLGVPGKVVRTLTAEQVEGIVKNAREYRKLAERYRL
ncbi:MAG: gamma carbonic anhydrase family protein [Methanomicrobiales archaeon]|nr:gamma carbonic anhydrase family protein [Methanomicrobiales archaeon]